MKTLSIRIPIELWQAIKNLAKEEDRSFNNMLIQLIKQALKERRVIEWRV